MNTKQRVRRDYTQSTLTQVRRYTRIRNGKRHIVKATIRGKRRMFKCKECHKSFTKRGNRIKRKFCSRACYRKDWIKRIAGWNKGLTGQTPWNKGLTKETDKRVAKYTRTMTKKVRSQFRNGERKVNGFRHWKQTDIEIILWNILDELKIKYHKNYPINLNRFTTFPDAFIPNKRVCIYADGEYWHNYPRYNSRDKETNKILQQNGYSVLRFWSRELKKNLLNCVKKIKAKI